ncbi:hypothetical protein [Pseudovibrio ascidiaceicola]|uniref:hypothetical protein n=1 Tax=Pseudovibrio ascidiaceicola TaxID=285279 RepID=UPI000D69F2BB|nr:hypothetical protein [Pseudovibrio ascidiaceicola]
MGDRVYLTTTGAEVPFYDIDNLLIEQKSISTNIRLKHWREVDHGANTLAIEAFIDEITHLQALIPLSTDEDS